LALIRHRETARVLLQADSGRFLLLYSLWSPESALEPRWMSPGGGIERSEELSEAASRELLEETGLGVPPEALGSKVAEIEFHQPWPSGDFETGIAHFFRLRISDEFLVDRSMWTAEEHRDILDVRWWNPEALQASGETVGPPGLVELLVELSELDT
jgi:8-oxo-dGTP pyrophosphatase MutT (NUDIX family)